MSNDNHDDRRHRLRFSVLYGLFEADATGSLAIGGALLALMLMGAGRWCGLW